MSVLARAALEASPLADLHAIASELSIDGYRRLRKDDLIDTILSRQDGVEVADDGELAEEDLSAAEDRSPAEDRSTGEAADEDDGASETAGGRRRRGRRGGRGRATRPAAEEPAEAEAAAEPEEAGSVAPSTRRSKPARADETAEREEAAPARTRTRRARGGASATTAPEEEPAAEEDEGESAEGDLVEGVVELLANGSGFLRVAPPDPSDDDVYISAAQVKRCELVGGDRISGPKRVPRRSERFASLIRVDTINGRPASELADGVRYEDLPASFPTERFRLGSEDPTLKAIEWLTPFGRGSRVTITGAAWAGKSHALRLLAEALATDESTTLFIALAGVRPEEISDWAESPVAPASAVSFAASAEAQDHVVELVVEQARRTASRGADAVVLIDTLDGLHPPAARKALASARNISGGGSLTVIATSTRPLGGETTVIALDAALTSTGRFPALELVGSGTLRPELLVGEAGAQVITEARAEALG